MQSYARTCNVTGSTEGRNIQSKRARAGSLVMVDEPTSGANCRHARVVFLWRHVSCVLLRFRLFAFIVKPWPFVQSFFDMPCPPPATRSYLTTVVCALVICCFFGAFCTVLSTLSFSFFRMVFFGFSALRPRAGFLTSAKVRIEATNQPWPQYLLRKSFLLVRFFF